MFNWWHTSIGGWHMERRPGSSSSFGRFSLLWSHLEGCEDMIAADGNAYIQLPAYIYSNKDSWLHTWNMYFLVFSVIRPNYAGQNLLLSVCWVCVSPSMCSVPTPLIWAFCTAGCMLNRLATKAKLSLLFPEVTSWGETNCLQSSRAACCSISSALRSK